MSDRHGEHMSKNTPFFFLLMNSAVGRSRSSGSRLSAHSRISFAADGIL